MHNFPAKKDSAIEIRKPQISRWGTIVRDRVIPIHAMESFALVPSRFCQIAEA